MATDHPHSYTLWAVFELPTTLPDSIGGGFRLRIVVCWIHQQYLPQLQEDRLKTVTKNDANTVREGTWEP
jgi:hypothetical protein